MIDMVKKFLGKAKKKGEMRGGTDSYHDIRIASCALLIEMSHIDGEFSKQDQERIISILRSDFSLSEEHAQALLEDAKKELEGSIDLWQFTNLINRNYSSDEKAAIIETVWKIAYFDGRLDRHENYLVKKIAQLLHVDHKRLIEAKLKVKGE